MYQHVDAVVVRAAAWPGGRSLPEWPDLTGEHDGAASWPAWLREVWDLPGFAAAVETASPSLARGIRRICDGRQLPERDARRVVVSALRYLLRASGRATPFGLFAGVAPVGAAAVTCLATGQTGHRAVARVDAAWLAQVVELLEDQPALRPQVDVVATNLAFVRDGRLVLRWRPSPAKAEASPAEASIRNTGPVRAVMVAARSLIGWGELAGKLAADFPGTSASVIDSTLAELVRQRFLLSSLRPPTTAADPLGQLLERLDAAHADQVPEIAPLLARLRRIGEDLHGHNDPATTPETARTLRASLVEQMSELAGSGHPTLGVDLLLDWDLHVGAQVLDEAARAAAVLVRLARRPVLSRSWVAWHGRFLERYGPGAVVRLADVLDADTGLGYPDGYRDHPATTSEPALSDRDRKLLTLAQKAAVQGHTEIVLDEQMLADLAVIDAASPVQPHTELTVRLHTASTDAVAAGDFRLALLAVSRAAGTTAGRFLDLFDPDDQARMSAAYRLLPTANRDAISAQATGGTPYASTDNVARAPRVLPHLIALGETGTGCGEIDLDDLAVSADTDGLYLISPSTRRPVEPVVFNAVEMVHHAHPLLRFLREVPTALHTPCEAFSWGAAGALPFLPALRYGRTLISGARWTISAADLPGPGAPWPQWTEALEAFREQFTIPGSVYLGGGDLRIPVDLQVAAHRALLRAEIDRAGHAALTPTPPTGALDWIGGHAHEIVIPLATTRAPAEPKDWKRPAGRDCGQLPGAGEWLYAKIYGHRDQQDAILTRHLPRLLAVLGDVPWWFLRYADPRDHLRLRFRIDADSAAVGSAVTRIGAWAAELREAGLSGTVQFDTYFPETGRFGTGRMLHAAETLFAADSAAAAAQLAVSGGKGGPDVRALTAASMVDLVIATTGDTATAMRWLIEHAATTTGAPARDLYNQALDLSNPANRQALLEAAGGQAVAASWARRHQRVADLCDALRAQGRPRDSLLPDLLHLHHVRISGISPAAERTCLHLARAAALSWTARNPEGTP